MPSCPWYHVRGWLTEGSYKSICGERAQVGRPNSSGSRKASDYAVIHKADILRNNKWTETLQVFN